MIEPEAPVLSIMEELRSGELSFAELFTIAMRIAQTHFSALILLWLLYYVPLHVMNHYSTTLIRSAGVMENFGYSMGIMFVTWIFGTFSLGAHIAFFGGLLRGEPISIRAAYDLAVRRLGALLGTGFLMGLLVGLWALLFLVPGIIAAIRYGLCLHAVVLDEGTAGDALSDSKQLVEGRWWPMFGLTLFSALFAVVSGFLVSSAVGSLLPYYDYSSIVVRSVFSFGTLFASIMVVARYVNYRALSEP